MMKRNVFDRILYDECCGQHPGFCKNWLTGKWAAVCTGCGRTVEEEKPEDLPVKWNLDVRKRV